MTDQPTALRHLVAAAIHHYDNEHALSGNDMPSKHHYGEADAVLAALTTAGIRDAARQASGQQPDSATPECAPCDDTGACNGGPCAHPAAGLSDTQPAVEAHPPQEAWRIELLDVDGWMPSGLVRPDRELVASYLAGRRKQRPDAEFRLVRETTTWTVEEDETP